MFMELYRKEKREEGDRGGQEDKRGESKGERQIQPVISSLGVLPSPDIYLRTPTTIETQTSIRKYTHPCLPVHKHTTLHAPTHAHVSTALHTHPC